MQLSLAVLLAAAAAHAPAGEPAPLLLTFTPDALSTGLELVQVLGLAGLILAALLLVARC